jgi:hypothetical protein
VALLCSEENEKARVRYRNWALVVESCVVWRLWCVEGWGDDTS